MKNLALAVSLAAALLASAAQAQTSTEAEGCSRDTDCKSQRICVQRQCVWPGEQPSDVAPPSPPRDSDITSSQPPPPPPPGYYPEPPRSAPPYRRSEQERHRGVFLRLDVGVGYMGSSYSQNGADFTVAGAAIATSFAIGGSVARNQALAFHFWVMATGNPKVTVNGTDAGTLNNTTTSLIGLGPEYNIYTPSNWYFSITPSLTRLHTDNSDDGSSGDTNWGFGARLAVGKEWWLGDRWGLGLAAQFTASTNTDQGDLAPTVTTFGGALAFSATWN
jgi:opacity protein-like surface antigen